MRIETYFTTQERSDHGRLADATVIVIDVMRATTTIVEALANGARAIYPVVSTEGAVKLAQSLGREDTLLCGERRGQKVEGFDLGNSPAEFTREAVEGKRLVMSDHERDARPQLRSTKALGSWYAPSPTSPPSPRRLLRSTIWSSSVPAERGASRSPTPCLRGHIGRGSGSSPGARAGTS